MFTLALTCVVSGACVWSAARAARTARHMAPRDVPSAVRTLSKLTSGDVEAVRSVLIRAGCPLESSDPNEDSAFHEGWIPALNEHLGDVSVSLAKSELVPRAAARICLFTGVFSAVIDLARQIAAGQPSAAPLVSFAAGLAGTIVCSDLARRTARSAQRVRKEWDTIALFASKILAEPPRKR